MTVIEQYRKVSTGPQASGTCRFPVHQYSTKLAQLEVAIPLRPGQVRYVK